MLVVVVVGAANDIYDDENEENDYGVGNDDNDYKSSNGHDTDNDKVTVLVMAWLCLKVCISR